MCARIKCPFFAKIANYWGKSQHDMSKIKNTNKVDIKNYTSDPYDGTIMKEGKIETN